MNHDQATKDAWQNLLVAARGVPNAGNYETKLWDAAKQLVAAMSPSTAAPRSSQQKAGPVVGTYGKQLRSGEVAPFGRTKGTPIEELETKELDYFIGAVRKSIDDPTKDRWVEKNQLLLNALLLERNDR